jgi:ribosome biogenesis GTPase / thiamine phosphate phosphatase
MDEVAPLVASTPPGWDAGWEETRAAADPAGAYTAVRISAEHRGAYHAIAGADVAMVELRGKHYRAATDKRDLPAVGDFCLVSRWERSVAKEGSALIEAILPRRSLLVRRAAGNATLPQPLSANVDLAMIVTSANSDLSAQRIDRYLELVRDSGISPLIVVSKLDLAGDEPGDADALLAEVEAMAPGVPVMGTSVPLSLGFDRVAKIVGAGKTAILIGSSGVGKSSILNALAASAAHQTGEVRASDERGQHTTTTRQLFAMPDGSLWIDTPGMRELAAFAEGDPAIAFPDVIALAATCKFADCQHNKEPGCAVTAAVAKGALAAPRLASYQKLRDERAVDRERQTVAARIAATRAGQRAAKAATRKRPG